MRRLGGREARRMMERMGIDASEIADVKQVIIKAANREIVLENPTVTALDVQGQKMFQIVAEKIVEKTPTTTPSQAKTIPEEDVQLVALQANVDPAAARKALEETGGDLAQAILLLGSRRK